MTELTVQLRDAQPRHPVPAALRFRRALKVLLRDFGLRAKWAPILEDTVSSKRSNTPAALTAMTEPDPVDPCEKRAAE